MHARGLLIRGSGLVVLSLSVFYGCGGLNEADVTETTDGSALSSAGCGDGKITPPEECDGTHLGGATCKTATSNSTSTGVLGCTSKCKFDTRNCSGTSGSGGGSGTGGGFGNGGAFVGNGGRFGGGGGVVGNGGRMTGGGGGGAPNVACTSDASCGRNRVCCGTQQGAFACQTACGRTDLPAGCGKSSDCANGQTCCGTLNGNQSAYTALACAATCGANDYVLCTSNRDCTTQGTTCQASRLLPTAFKVCR
jgi:hypothetical protein